MRGSDQSFHLREKREKKNLALEDRLVKELAGKKATHYHLNCRCGERGEKGELVAQRENFCTGQQGKGNKELKERRKGLRYSLPPLRRKGGGPTVRREEERR